MRAAVSFGFERHYILGLRKMRLRCGLALTLMLAMALGRVKEKQAERILSLSGPHSGRAGQEKAKRVGEDGDTMSGKAVSVTSGGLRGPNLPKRSDAALITGVTSADTPPAGGRSQMPLACLQCTSSPLYLFIVHRAAPPCSERGATCDPVTVLGYTPKPLVGSARFHDYSFTVPRDSSAPAR